MMENSIDAGCSNIEILVKDGGKKLLQITDNGSGIAKEDLPILCERFTTSKLSKFEDLSSIATYGFRGEALASISHIARMSVTTKTRSESCAYRCNYVNGKMSSEPKPMAGKDGTQICVEDLFYSMPSRLRALRSPSEEFSKIIDIVGKYAIHTPNVGFSCKKMGESFSALVVRKDSTLQQRIRTVFGSSVASDLITLEVTENADFGLQSCGGCFSSPNFTNKKSIPPVFFVNSRLVACEPLKKAINHIFSIYLPRGNKPFVYFDLKIDPHNVDVNVHPTKREVRFLYEEEIVEVIVSKVQTLLQETDPSRTFLTQRVMASQNSQSQDKQPYKRAENKLVRADFSQAKITSFMPSSPPTPTKKDDPYVVVDKERVDVSLTSVAELRAELEGAVDEDLTETFCKCIYIGIVDDVQRLAAIQCDLKLLLVDYASVSNQFFYQLGLSDFSNFGRIKLDDGLLVRPLLKSLYDNKLFMARYADPPTIDEVIQTLGDMSEMLDEYFSIVVEKAEDLRICAVPLLLKGYTPPLSKLPHLLFRLGTKVDWTTEKPCLEQVLRQIALFYIPEPSSGQSEFKDAMNSTLENVIFPSLKKRFLATKDLSKDVVEVANLPGLYKVFERC